MPKETDIHKTGSPAETRSGEGNGSHPAAVFVQQSAAKKKLWLWLVPIAGLAAILAFAFAPKATEHGADKKNQTIPVTVATATTRSIPIELRTIGNVLPYSVVNIVPQVGGQILKVNFTQGDFVRKGALLFELDPRPYQASLNQAKGAVNKDRAQIRAAEANLARDLAQIGQLEANLSKDVAQLNYAKTQLSRYLLLVKQGAVSKEQTDQIVLNNAAAEATIAADKKAIENARAVAESDRAQIETAQGTLQIDEAAVQNAEIQLGWTKIYSPLDGRTSSLNIYAGNVVSANNQTPLVSISQVAPIYISFTLPEEYLAPLRRCLADKTLSVEAMISGSTEYCVNGAVSFLENTVNTASGTIAMRATFSNNDKRLYPGQFVDVVVSMPPDGDSIVIPASALQTTQQGNSVYVVGPDKKAKLVVVELKRTQGNWAAISNGLSAGDVVVTDGQLQLIPGSPVQIVQSKEPTNSSNMDGAPGRSESSWQSGEYRNGR